MPPAAKPALDRRSCYAQHIGKQLKWQAASSLVGIPSQRREGGGGCGRGPLAGVRLLPLGGVRWLNSGRCTSEVPPPLGLVALSLLVSPSFPSTFSVPSLRAGSRLPIFPHLIVSLSLPSNLILRHFRGCRLGDIKFAGESTSWLHRMARKKAALPRSGVGRG
jgi:hypothetical protein